MKLLKTAALALVLGLTVSGCREPVDSWTIMEAQVSPPPGVQQTRFAHIGHIEAPQGRFQVAVQQRVLTGMLAPRGQRQLHLFGRDLELVSSYSLSGADPLWCAEAKLYLFGHSPVEGIPFDPAQASRLPQGAVHEGNVIDFSAGVHRPVLRREQAYGSSGGVGDGPVDPPAD